MIKGRLAAAGALTLAATTLLAQSPIDYLRRSLVARDRTAVVLIQSQRPSMHSDDSLVSKVEYNGLGGWRRTVMQPLRLQGAAAMSDGKFMTMVNPADKSVSRMPASETTSTERRMEWVSKNFRAVRDRNLTIAGRNAIQLTFWARNRGIPSRRIALDAETNFMLKNEVPRKGQSSIVLLDTMSAEFFSNPLPQLIDFGVPSDYRLRIEGPRRSIADVSDARRLTNFDPIMPKQVPFGFELEDIELRSANPRSILAFRLRDGFNTVVVYQWGPGTRPEIHGAPDRRVTGGTPTVTFLVTGDLEVPELKRILQSFVQATGTK